MYLIHYMDNILYILPYRHKNQHRRKNLLLTLNWITKIKKILSDNYELRLDICVVEQDKEISNTVPTDQITHIFIHNDGIFNKGWAFNVVVKQFPQYSYYGFCDADIITSNIPYFCGQLVHHCVKLHTKAFRPFNNRFDTDISDMVLINTVDNVINIPQNGLTKHGGLSFASNMIFMNKETYDQIGGWDEFFNGWGRYDDFITYKLKVICQLNEVCVDIDAIHLWHPITLDFSLNQKNVYLYDKYTKYDKNNLIKLVGGNTGSPRKFDK